MGLRYFRGEGVEKFSGGGGVERFLKIEIFRFFLKSEGKEVDRKRGKRKK